MKKGGLEIDKMVAILIILASLFLLIYFATTKFDVVKEMIMGPKVK